MTSTRRVVANCTRRASKSSSNSARPIVSLRQRGAVQHGCVSNCHFAFDAAAAASGLAYANHNDPHVTSARMVASSIRPSDRSS